MLGKTAEMGRAFGNCCRNMVQCILAGIYEGDPNEHLGRGDM